MLVPIETTVSPTMMGRMPSRDASYEPPLTSASAPTIMATSPPANHARLASISLYAFRFSSA